ncbi:hypothetical protein KGF86_01025 [Ornithinibacillus massiliensis]|uniref:DUF4398 domain-containing protein n=1 Tax=Ornithinibacillus massiliensis TaxID=1944633 RepID=A0ABS5M902_9BACI|nr:hypothetical protein [Ornithinibacillus massiliensis]MBS3678788.1 hypothetical protein [Ornithinibacillus massiliensis]
MKKLLITSLFIIVILTGCSDEGYHNAIQKGLDYIAIEEYQKAEGAFELALEEKKQDAKATALLSQTSNYLEALTAHELDDIELAEGKAQDVIKETEGSEALIKKAEEILSAAQATTTADAVTNHSETMNEDMNIDLTIDEAVEEIERLWEEWEQLGPYTEIEYVGTEAKDGVDYHYFYVGDYDDDLPPYYYGVNSSNGKIYDYTEGYANSPLN